MSPMHLSILKKMRNGPVWIRSLGPYKPIADRLCDGGLVERCKPVGGSARNMMRLTAAGQAALDRQAA